MTGVVLREYELGPQLFDDPMAKVVILIHVNLLSDFVFLEFSINSL